LVLVGPVDDSVAEKASKLADLPNVALVGEQPSHAMPSFAQHFDVGVIWFVVDHLTEGVTPLKMYELLAAGTPCVSTPLPAAVGEPAVDTAADSTAMVAAIERALQLKDRGALEAAGRQADWTSRLSPLIERLLEVGLDRAR
jgi:hypothetical protein